MRSRILRDCGVGTRVRGCEGARVGTEAAKPDAISPFFFHFSVFTPRFSSYIIGIVILLPPRIIMSRQSAMPELESFGQGK